MVKIKEKAFWIFVGDVAGRGFSFLASIYLARVLGEEFYGLIIFAISVLGYATWSSDLGLIHIGTLETAKKPEKRIFRIIEVFRLKIFLGVVVLLGFCSVIWFIDIESTQKQVLLGYMLSLIPYMFLMEWLYAGKQEFGKVAVSKVLNGLIYFLLIILLINSKEDILLIPVLYTAGVCAAALALGIFAIRNKPFSLPPRGMHIYRDLLKTSTTIGFGQFFAQLVNLLPPILIGLFLSFGDTGLYGAAFRVVIIAMMVDRVFVNLLLPNLSAVWSIDKHAAIAKVSTVYRTVTAGGALIALFIALSAEQIIELLYGAQYQESAILLQILSIMIAVTFINSLFSFGLIATNNDQKYFLATSIGGILAATTILVSTLFGNIISATIAVVLAEIFITLSTYFWFRKVIPSDYLKPVLITYSLALFLFVGFVFIPLNPFINAVIACMIFIVAIIKFGVIKQDHIKWIKSRILS
jgi:O-antigen/teichoic acid export membrane protein